MDVAYYGNANQLAYDFLLQAGASPEHIRMRLSGADDVRIDRDGDFVLSMPNGDVRLRKPVAYQMSPDGKRRESVQAG